VEQPLVVSQERVTLSVAVSPERDTIVWVTSLLAL
jgi:hypothetical protein